MIDRLHLGHLEYLIDKMDLFYFLTLCTVSIPDGG